MSKGKVYKKKSKLGGNIFVILGVILALLIVATVIFTSIDNSKFNGLMEDYYEFTYGEKKNIKLTKMQDPNTGMILYSDNEYAYYVEDDIIYDTTRTEAEVEGFKAKVTELSADFGEVTTSNYAEYIDGKDFSKEYAYVQIAATYECPMFDGCYRIWNFYECQTTAMSECSVSNAGNRIRDNCVLASC